MIGREKKPEPSSRRYFIHFDKIGRKTGVSLRRKRKGELRRIHIPWSFFEVMGPTPRTRTISHGSSVTSQLKHIVIVPRSRHTVKSTRQHRYNHIAVNDLPLAGGSPDVLEVTVTLGQAVERVVTLAAGTDEAAESEGLVLAGVATVLVNLADGELDGGVVVGLDDAVGGAALAGHVAVGVVSFVILCEKEVPFRSCSCCVPRLRRGVRNLFPRSRSVNPVQWCSFWFGIAGLHAELLGHADTGHRVDWIIGNEAMTRTDRRSLPCRSPFWRVWW